MIEQLGLFPLLHIMTGLARKVSPMRVAMTGDTILAFEMIQPCCGCGVRHSSQRRRRGLVDRRCGHLRRGERRMALAAFHRRMRPRQHEFGLCVALARECGWLKTVLRVAAIALIEVRRFREFTGVRICVAIVAQQLLRHI